MNLRRYWRKVVTLTVVAGLLLAVWPAVAQAQEPEWEWQEFDPADNYLKRLWGSSGSDAFAVGDWGTILHYDGSSWSAMSGGTKEHLFGVWGSSTPPTRALSCRVLTRAISRLSMEFCNQVGMVWKGPSSEAR